MKHTTIASLVSIFILLSFFTPNLNAQQQEPQFRGPNRDGCFPASGLLKSWPENGPEKILVIDSLGSGYASVVYFNNNIYVTGKKDSLDYLTSLKLSGEINWQIPFGKAWPNSFPDTRSTPTIHEENLYLISGVGELVCINQQDGTILWKVNVDSTFNCEWGNWGVSESPLIVDDKVICTPAGKLTSMVAYNKETGKLIWQTDTVGGRRTYGSPAIYNYDGVRQIIGYTDRYVFGVNPDNGAIEWTYHYFPENETIIKRGAALTNTPIIDKNEFFVTCGYDLPVVKLKITNQGKTVEECWTDTILDNHHHGVILVDGYLYGSNWQNNKDGNWVCKNWETGETMYETTWGTKGTIIYADGLLYVLNEKDGNVGLVKPNTAKFDLISSFKLEEGNGPYWAHPAIYDGKLFLRHGESLVVYNLKK